MIGLNKFDNSKIGKVSEPYTCCDPRYHIYNGVDQLKYIIIANCCQCGLCCKNCAEAKFDIYSNFGENISSEPVGSITKQFSGVVQEMLTDADNFEIKFPNDATPEDKLMIIGTTLMIDYRFFEDNGNSNNHKHRY